MDKPVFLHNLKDLRHFQTAEQGLRLAGTLTGQKNGRVQVAWFRTFDPVDMHGFVHSGVQLMRVATVFRFVRQHSAALAITGKADVAMWACLAA